MAARARERSRVPALLLLYALLNNSEVDIYMKRISTILLTMLLLAGGASGCGNTNNTGSDPDKLHIVCTVFPAYDWTRELLGSHADEADISYLLDSGADLHSFQPTAQDMVKISECDLFLYVGGESDGWAEDALKSAKNQDMHAINLLEALGDAAKEEEIKEGMEAEEEEEAEDEPEYDEHVWLSLSNAKLFCDAICSELSALDADNASDYAANCAEYTAKLDDMDSEYRDMADNASCKTLLFGDRFPFRYLTDDYGLDYYAAFVGCSAETEASFETISFLAGKADELHLDTVFTLENSDKSIAEALIRNTNDKNQTIAELDSMQSVTADKADDGASYLGIMQKNLDILKEALK